VESPLVLLGGRIAVQGLQEAGGEFWRVAVIVPGIPRRGLRGRWSYTLHPSVKGTIGRYRHLQVSRYGVEQAGHVRGALNVGVTAKRVDASAGAANVTQQELQHRRGANNLRAEAVLRPPHRVNNRSGLLHIAVF